LSAVAFVIAMPAVTTMSVMHEHVHQRASEEWQPNENAKDVRAVLGEEQSTSDGKEPEQNKPGARCREAALRLTFMLRVIVYRHRSLQLPSLRRSAASAAM
jgi:hypothetical protein